jgi:biopolymer transport protein ExbD
MGMDLGGSGGPKSEINVTPLVDVVLVLLIIFMVVQPLLQMGYDVQVPPNSKDPIQQQQQPPDQIIVSLTANKEVFLNKEKVEISNLPIRIGEILRNRGSKVVFFSVEDSVNYGDAMKVMDIVRNNGAKNIGIVMDWVNPASSTP